MHRDCELWGKEKSSRQRDAFKILRSRALRRLRVVGSSGMRYCVSRQLSKMKRSVGIWDLRGPNVNFDWSDSINLLVRSGTEWFACCVAQIGTAAPYETPQEALLWTARRLFHSRGMSPPPPDKASPGARGILLWRYDTHKLRHIWSPDREAHPQRVHVFQLHRIVRICISREIGSPCIAIWHLVENKFVQYTYGTIRPYRRVRIVRHFCTHVHIPQIVRLVCAVAAPQDQSDVFPVLKGCTKYEGFSGRVLIFCAFLFMWSAWSRWLDGRTGMFWNCICVKVRRSAPWAEGNEAPDLHCWQAARCVMTYRHVKRVWHDLWYYDARKHRVDCTRRAAVDCTRRATVGCTWVGGHLRSPNISPGDMETLARGATQSTS